MSELYLRERRYDNHFKQSFSNEKIKLWYSIFGEKLVDSLAQNIDMINKYLKNESWICEQEYISMQNDKRPYESCIFLSIDHIGESKSVFWNLYKEIFEYGYYSFFNNNKWRYEVTDDALKDIFQSLMRKMDEMSIRSIIQEIKIIKNGCKTVTNAYDLLLAQLADEKYRRDFYGKYPVLKRCLREFVYTKMNWIKDVLTHFNHDKRLIESELLCGKRIHRICNVEMLSTDTHNGGKCVLKFRVDTGDSFVYKPHDVKNEVFFYELLNYYGEKCHIKMKSPKTLSGADYGWVEFIEGRSCENEYEIKRYYYRMGIIVFVAYLLQIGDIHCENVIASGENPIVIDLETIMQMKEKEEKLEIVEAILKESVISTYLLPYAHWKNGAECVDSSGISGGNCEIPFIKIPYLKDPKTENMHIEYRTARLGNSVNRACLKGVYEWPEKYTDLIIHGFENAYLYTLNHKRAVETKLSSIRRLRCRYLLQDTKKYQMLLQASYQPAVLHDGADREMLLHALWKNRDLNYRENYQIVNAEIGDLLAGDIPYFSLSMESTDLETSKSERIKNYFSETPIQHIFNKLENIDGKDLKRQKRIIRCCMQFHNGYIDTSCGAWSGLRSSIENAAIISNKELLKWAERIGDRLLEEAEYNKDETQVDWMQIKLLNNKIGAIDISSCGKYLYNGVGGILVYMRLLSFYIPKRQYLRLCDLIEEDFFRYTDLFDLKCVEYNKFTSGLYNGEASVTFVYYILYQITGDVKYYVYMLKHTEILYQIALRDENSDLLDGRSGAVLMLTMVFELTRKNEYLTKAKIIADELIKSAENMKNGLGWRNLSTDFKLAGMSHGNAGIALAFLKIYSLTDDYRYYNVFKGALTYENSLYDMGQNDWQDIRKTKEEFHSSNVAAWCHGAGGILLSRMIMCHYKLEKREERIVKRDLDNASKYLEMHMERDEICLCHGIVGNILLWDLYKKQTHITKTLALNSVRKFIIPLKEWYNPGLMNGYTGIGYYFLMKYSDKFLNYLFLEGV